MIDRTTKLRWRRGFRRRQRQLEDIGSQTEEQIDRHFFRRLGRLYEVRRFLLSWLLLVVLLAGTTLVQTRGLSGYFQDIKPLAGGIYSEGIVGSFTNANPIFAVTEVDSAVSRLVFSSLLTYDQKNRLVGDMASDWAIDKSGKTYTVILKSNLIWHDGVPLTAKDVVFTFRTIQNPDAKSPYFSAWKGIKVTAPNAQTVVFTLPNILASFPYSLTTGIIPRHALKDTLPGSLRSSLFNTTEPVGAGPFKWNGVEVRRESGEAPTQRVSLVANEAYSIGKPKLSEFVIRTYSSDRQMAASFENGELTAMAGLQDVPEKEQNALDVTVSNIPLTGSVMVFLRNSQAILKDPAVRRALTLATDRHDIITSLQYPSIISTGPFIEGMIGYDKDLLQLKHSLGKAKDILDKAGWRLKDGIRTKKGKQLKLTLNTLNTTEYAEVANQLQKQWKSVGVELEVISLDQADLQTAIRNRRYDILLYGISLGLDSDQFAYWHGSQADPRVAQRLNFSDYNSKIANAALEAGRTRIDKRLRAAKYEPFLETWRRDAPAIALYQPRFLYVTKGIVFNLSLRSINSPADRFANVHNWMVRTERTTIE